MQRIRDRSAGETVRRPVAVLPRSVWSSDVVRARLAQAAVTLRFAAGDWPSQRTTWWPDVVRSFFESYGRDQARASSSRPSPRAIDECDEALAWLLKLEDQAARQLVWGRACGIKWRRLVERFGLSERTLRERHRQLILGLVLALNK